MVNIIIPTYKAKKTLPKALDSLVAQTKQLFMTTIVQDCDNEDYTDIINEYKRRGLQIFLLKTLHNSGPGMARQLGIDSCPMCDYVMFMDSDDMLTPRAVEILTREIQINSCDIIVSDFIAEGKATPGILMSAGSTPVTWTHGKIYKRSYLVDNNIRFLDEFRLNEDAYFNLVAINSTKNRKVLNESTYIWRDCETSLTRVDGYEEFFKKTSNDYIKTQTKGLWKIYDICHEIDEHLIIGTLFNIYYTMMKQDYFKVEGDSYLEDLFSLRNLPPVQEMLAKGENWQYIVNNVKAGAEINKNIIFYKKRFVDWILEYIQNGGKENNDIYS